jgi:hypothetical protein
MSNLRDAARQALEALEYIHTETTAEEDNLIHTAIAALRSALEQQEQEPGFWGRVAARQSDKIKQLETALAALKQPEQEPVAWQGVYDKTDLFYSKPPQADVRPLYTHPPRREWQGLTDEEIGMLYVTWDATPGVSMADFARAIEQACKERNT